MKLSYIKVIGSTVGGFIVGYLGGWDILLKSLCLLVILDFVTRFISNVYNQKKLSSELCFKGICKKVQMFVYVMLSVIVQHMTGDSIPLRDIVVIFYIVNEALSVLENGGEVLQYPERLKQVIEDLQGDS